MDPYAGYGYRDAAHMADPDEAANALETDLAIEHDEELLFNVRQSPLTPIAQLWPIALGLFGWVALNAVSEAVVGSPIPWITQVGVLVLVGALTLRWIIRDGLGWYVRWYTLTDQRLIVAWGLLRRFHQEAALSQIQTVRVGRANLIANILNIGDVEAQTAGATGDLRLTGVAAPQAIMRAITLAQQERLDERGDAGGAMSLHPAVQDALAAIGGGADDDDGPLDPDPEGALSARWFRRSIPITLLPGERVVRRLYRHWFVLLTKLWLPLLIGVVAIVVASGMRVMLGPLVGTASWIVFAVGGGVALIWSLLTVANYIDDIFILTTQRIIDIDRQFFIISEERREAMYRNVQNVSVNTPLIGRLFGYGHIIVETAGQSPNIEMNNIARPRETQDRIFALVNSDKKRREEMEDQRERKGMHDSIGVVLSALMLVTPDVRGLPVTVAATRLRAAGLSVSVAGERPSSHVPPGSVLMQSPGPGATALRGAEVALTLSRRPTPMRP